MTKKIRLVCFSVNVYNVIAGKTEGFGGAETQMWNVARAFATHGDYDVHLITVTDETTRSFDQEGVRVHPIKPAGDLRTFGAFRRKAIILFKGVAIFWKLLSLKGEVYYTNIASEHVISVWAAAFLRRAPYVYRLAHDWESVPDDLDRNIFPKRTLTSRLFQFTMKYTDVLVGQTRYQVTQLKKHFHRDAVQIPNGHNIPDYAETNSVIRNGVLWIGRSHSMKRPWLVAELAELLPDVQFQMLIVDTIEGGDEYQRIKKAAARLKNLELLQPVPATKINSLHRQAQIFLLTSEFEGLPNVVIEALKNGTPVLSLGHNPDGLFAGEDAVVSRQVVPGFCFPDNLAMAQEVVQLLLREKSWRQACHECAYATALSRFSIETTISVYDRHIKASLRTSKAPNTGNEPRGL